MFAAERAAFPEYYEQYFPTAMTGGAVAPAVQIDDPFLSDLFGDPAFNSGQRLARPEIYVAALNASLAGIPPERVRNHTCIHEAALADVADYRLRVNAGADCGFSPQATYTPEVHPTVFRAKFEALRGCARIASNALWSRGRS